MRRLASLVLACLPMTAAAAAPCEAPEHHHFDFWLGEWNVVAPEGAPEPGKALGRNRIERVAAGCGLLEHWTGASGFEGKSLNAWDAAAATWRQFWVGGDGTVLRLEGGLVDGAMVMTGELGAQRQRITWTPRDDGGVTQHWQVSDDAGASWTTSFLGVYRRVAAP